MKLLWPQICKLSNFEESLTPDETLAKTLAVVLYNYTIELKVSGFLDKNHTIQNNIVTRQLFATIVVSHL